MSEDEKKIDETDDPTEESFAQLFEKSFVKPVKFTPGQKVRARIVKISAEAIFLDLGGKSEGYLDAKELQDAEGNLSVKEGDVVEAYLLSASNNELRFTTQITGGDAGRHHLEEAWQNGIPVEGLIEKEIKGGFEIRIAGGLRGFCPFSQMGLQRTGDAKSLLGQHLTFRITQFGEKGRNIVLSNRAVLEEERRKQKEALKDELREGMKVSGTISSIQGFGAFVRIGTVEGLIPISEIAYDRVEDIHQLLQVGQEVEVIALKLDWEKDRLSFSLKRAQPDPWKDIEQDFPPGSRHTGSIARLTNFGAFVTLAPGVDGLLHISKLGGAKRIKHPREAVAAGQIVEVKIDGIDKENKRLSLSLAGSEDADDTKQKEDDYTRFLKEKPKSMGTLADLLKKKIR